MTRNKTTWYERLSIPRWTNWAIARLLPPCLAGLAVVAIWHLAVVQWEISRLLLPSPREVGRRFVEDQRLLAAAWLLTGRAALAGLVLSIVAGAAVGILFSQSKWLRYALYPYAIFLQTVPIVAIAPLLVLWLGYGTQGVVAVAFVLSLFPVITSMTAGMTQVPHALEELFTLYQATRWQRMRKLRIPHAVPSLVTGIKTSSGLSVIGAIVGEFFVGYGETGFGLGYLIRSSAESYQTPRLFAAVISSTILGVTVFSLVSLIGDWLIRRWGDPRSLR